MLRPLYLLAGLSMLALGIVGAVVPIMPTTIFLIIAAWCFARSSPKLEAWLMAHKNFGPVLLAWRDHGAISRRSKFLACLGMAFGMVTFWLAAQPDPWLAVLVGSVLVGCATFVVTRPSPQSREEPPPA